MSTFAEGFIKYGLDKGHIKPKEEDQKELDRNLGKWFLSDGGSAKKFWQVVRKKTKSIFG
jgi:hypothetical protein